MTQGIATADAGNPGCLLLKENMRIKWTYGKDEYGDSSMGDVFVTAINHWLSKRLLCDIVHNPSNGIGAPAKEACGWIGDVDLKLWLLSRAWIVPYCAPAEGDCLKRDINDNQECDVGESCGQYVL